MKSIIIPEHGGPDVLSYVEIPDPIPTGSEVVVKVKAVAMNYNDIWARKGLLGMAFKLPHIPGTDVSGEVVDIGPNVKTVKIGERVVIHPIISCRNCEHCTSGKEYFCKEAKVFGFQTGPLLGGYSQYTKVDEANIIPIPNDFSFPVAASLTACLGTSWHMLVTRGNIKPGETILIWGATGGIGIPAVQIAKLFNARVIAVVGSDEKGEVAKSLGADEVINYKTQSVFRKVRKLTDKRGVDMVFEHTGVETWNTSINCLAYGGRLVTCGNTTGYQAKLDLRVLFWKHLSLLGCHAMTKPEVLKGWEFVKSGQIKAVISDIIPLPEAKEAHIKFESGERIGKIVLAP